MKLLQWNRLNRRQALLLAVATLLFAAGTLVLTRMFLDRFDVLRYALPWAALFALLGGALLRQTGRAMPFISSAALLLLLMAALWTRVPLLPIESEDYIDCLSEWIAAIQAVPGLGALGASIGNYNAPYFYLLVLIGKLDPGASLYWIKFLSIAFEGGCAVLLARLVSLASQRTFPRLAAFFGALLLPTAILNGAAWAQCDAIFVFFSLAALYAGLKCESKQSLVLFAVAFSFKLQTVFLMPLALVLLLIGRIRLRDVWLFPAVFLALLLPAVLAGRPVSEVASIYYIQTGYYNYLQMNCPSIFGLFSAQARSTLLSYAAILAAGAVCIGLLAYLWQRRERLDNARLLDAAYLFALVIPFLLPHMHERYFFAADMLGVLYLVRHPKRWYMPVIGEISSLMVYLPFLFGEELALPLGVLSLAMLGITCMVARDLVLALESTRGCELGEAAR